MWCTLVWLELEAWVSFCRSVAGLLTVEFRVQRLTDRVCGTSITHADFN